MVGYHMYICTNGLREIGGQLLSKIGLILVTSDFNFQLLSNEKPIPHTIKSRIRYKIVERFLESFLVPCHAKSQNMFLY